MIKNCWFVVTFYNCTNLESKKIKTTLNNLTLDSLIILHAIYLSFLAAITEKILHYVVMKKNYSEKITKKMTMSFGLGWKAF